MEQKAVTFILTDATKWSRPVRIFIKGRNKKLEERTVLFTTEHIVPAKQRVGRGHEVPAEFTTSDPAYLEAMYRDTSYGKTFVEKGDPEGKKKQNPIIVTDEDKDLVALRGLFQMANLTMDENLPYEVLKQQYAIHMSALSGIKIEKSVAKEIPHVPVDVKASIEEGVNVARAAYFEKYGEPIPAIVANDLGFLDALADPNFDAKAYIENKIAQVPPVDEVKIEETIDAPVADDKEALAAKYFEKFKTNVPNPKKNDVAWIKAKLEE